MAGKGVSGQGEFAGLQSIEYVHLTNSASQICGTDINAMLLPSLRLRLLLRFDNMQFLSKAAEELAGFVAGFLGTVDYPLLILWIASSVNRLIARLPFYFIFDQI